MKRILTPEEMKRVDRFAIERLGILSLRLMEHAGKKVSEIVVERLRGRKTAVIVCGKGNNGGDGLVVARHLSEKGCDVTVAFAESPTLLRGDAADNLKRLRRETPDVRIRSLRQLLSDRRGSFSVVIDAMLGVSSNGPLRAPYRTAVRWCNRQKGLKVAIDLPTGLDGETGECGKDVFRSDITVTIAHPKIGFFRGRAAEVTGEIVTVDIGIPQRALNECLRGTVPIHVTEISDVRRTFPLRPVNSHKHSVGKVFILAGSRGMTGAALLCSAAAMRSGSGHVILGIPESEYPIIARRTVEVMPVGLPATPEGSLALEAIGEIEQRIRWCDVLVIGCGLSRHSHTQELIRTVITRCPKPMVIDADALFAVTGRQELIRSKKKSSIVLTPHMGEFERFSGLSAAEIEKDRFHIVSKYARELGVTLLLKGSSSIIAGPNGDVYVNPTGNSGMATAGSGDVLAGMIGALIGQGNRGTTAAVNGAFLHGWAGDCAAEIKGKHGMIARDIITMIPRVIKRATTI